MKKSRKGIEIEMLVWVMIAVFVLVILIIGYAILRGKGIGAIEFVKNLFRFRS